jgi:hypothetical protein
MPYTKRKKIKNRANRSRLWAIAGAGLVVAALGTGAWLYFDRQQTSKSADSTAATDGRSSTINMDPATPEEKQAAEDRKDEIAKEQEQSNNQLAGTKVTPVITYAGQYGGNIEVSAYIPGIIENGGTCTLTAVKGSSKVTKQVTGVDNAQNTSCPTFIVPRGDFDSAGTWAITISYSSGSYSGESASKTLEVK